MKQNLKKYIVLSVFLSCLFSGFLGVAQATNDEDSLDSLLGLSEEVTCDNMISVFEDYNNAVKLLEDVFSQSLDNMYAFVDDTSAKGQISTSDLNKQKKQIQEAKKNY